jgi:hypothetical protein
MTVSATSALGSTRRTEPIAHEHVAWLQRAFLAVDPDSADASIGTRFALTTLLR